MIPRFAVITTYERPAVALDCVNSVLPDADMVLVVDNGTEQPFPDPPDDRTLTPWMVLRFDEQPVNLSKLWNLGLTWAQEEARRAGYDEWDVAILNDDCIVQEKWFSQVQEAMREGTSVAACSGNHNVQIHRPEVVSISMRMTGWAFVVRGESGLRADEQFKWWCGDTDLDWQARLAGGMRMIPIGEVTNRFPNGYTWGDRMVQTGIDHEAFIAKWGSRAF
jgi:GT2 family glycosyltransferase